VAFGLVVFGFVAFGLAETGFAGFEAAGAGPTRVTETRTIRTAVFGLSFALRGTRAIFSTTSCPSTTWPKIVCFPVRCGVGTSVMKN
jgi:hypothetical protein